MTVVQSTNPPLVSTVPQVFALVGDEVCARWEALGQADSKIHWAYGMEAEALISENIPAMLAYKAIAIKAGKKAITIRQAYYTYIAFTDEQREKYELCPYSIFRIARSQDDREAVLKHYLDTRASVDEMEITYPENPDKDIDIEFNRRGYPRIFYGIYREIWMASDFLRARAIEIMNELSEIIKEANKQ